MKSYLTETIVDRMQQLGKDNNHEIGDKDEFIIIDYRDIDICCLSPSTKTINIHINGFN